MTYRRIVSAEDLAAIHSAGEGYVLNSEGRRLHRASCAHVARMGLGTTKFLVPTLKDTGSPGARSAADWTWCPACRPESASAVEPTEGASTSTSREVTLSPGGLEEASPSGLAEFEFAGWTSRSEVQAWADAPVPFEPKTDDTRALRRGLLERIARLQAGSNEVLEATFFGPKDPRADVENLLLYNLSTSGQVFAGATQAGLRFELALSEPPRAPSGVVRRFSYLYRVGARADGWRGWTVGRQLAQWDPCEVLGLDGSKRAEATWWAMRRAAITVAESARTTGQAFGAQVVVHPPTGRRAQLPGVVKGLLDGLVASLQCHDDRDSLPEVSTRLARSLDADPRQVARLLSDDDRAVLGHVDRLLWARAQGIQWNPSDTDLVAAEILIGPALSDVWAISGAVVELSPVAEVNVRS